MPVSGTRPREVSPTRPAPMPLAAPNSPARRGAAARNTGLLEPYHDIASTFFQVGKGPDLDDIFLTASRDGDFERIFELLRRRNEAIINIDARDRVTGNTPLIWASKRGHGKIVQQLLKHGADVTLRNYEGQTAVEVASPAIRNQLLESVDKGGPHRNLLQAAWQGDAKLLKKILSEARVDINCRNGDGLTPLLLVTRDVQLFEKLRSRGRGFEPQQVVSELLTSRADPNAIDEEGRTALHYVSSSKAFQGSDIIKMLLKDGSDVHTRDRRCFTPIHCASQTGNVDIVVALLNGGSEANARGYAGSTPLHISAINGHDNVVNKLLQHGADVTIVDDSGLTAVDVAKTKKVKQTLKQAWAEATQGKIKENLGPVRPPSSSSRRSFDGATAAPPPPKSPKKGGQVIFDTLPTTSSSSLDALTPRRAAVTLLQRQLNDAEKIRKAEDQRMRDVISASPMSRSRTPSATTPRGISGQRLSPLRNTSPAKGSRREIKFSPGTKDYDGGCYGTANRRKSTGGTTTTPLLHRECSIPVTMLGFDLDDNLQDARSRRPGQPMTKKVNMYRSFSSDSSVDPCEEFYLRGQTSSRTSLSTNADWEDASPDSSSPTRPGSIRTPSASSLNRLTTIEERSVASDTRPLILDLDQMRLLNAEQSPIFGDSAINQHPTSQHLLPPTPIYMQNGDQGFDIRDVEYDDLSGSSKENSPRTEEEIEHTPQAVDNKAYCGEVRLAVTNVNELTREKTVLNQGQFNIENTRVQHSDDSGCPEEISSSNRSSVNSSDGTTPADVRHEPQTKTVKDSKPLSVGSTGTKSDVTVDPREKLRMAAQENAIKKQTAGEALKSTVQCNSAKGNAAKGGVTVYSDALKGDLDSNTQNKPPQAKDNTSMPSHHPTEPTSSSANSPPTASAPAPEPFPLDEPADASQASSPNKGLLKIKLVPNKPTQSRVPPDRPPPPGKAIKEGSRETNVTKSSNIEQKSTTASKAVTPQTVTKQAPPRPVAPPRSRTPSASSVSSSGSSGSSAPSRPPPPKQTSTAVKPAAVKSNVAKKKTPTQGVSSAKTAENKKLATQTTSFRLSTYLQQKPAVASYNLAKTDADSSQVTAATTTQHQTVKSGPSIILTSQSQTQFDLSAIPDVLTTQPPSEEDIPAPAQQVKQITVKEASPLEVAPSSPTKNDPLNKSLAASISEVKLNEKPTADEHNGPVIWDPFETIRAQQKQLESESEERPKSGRILKSATKRKASERQQSAVQRTNPAKSKDGKLNDCKKGVRPRSPRSRPKSPRSRSKSPRSNNNKKTKKKKGKKSDNKVEVLIPDHPELNNVALIGGVGWQLKTECNEDEPVHQVKFGRPPLDYDTDDEPTPRLTVVPNYVDDQHSPTDMDDDSQYNQYLQLPGQYAFEDSDTGGSSEDDISYLLPDAEETLNEVVFDLTPRRVNAVVMEVQKNKMLSPRNIPLKRGGTVDDDLEEIIPDESVSSPKRPSIEDKNGNAEDSPLETAEEGQISEDPPTMRAFDKKGVMNWKKKSPRSADVASARTSRSQNLSSATSTKSASQNTPKPTAKTTPGTTPKQTPNATPSTTPKQTPGNTPKTTPTGSPKKTVTVANENQDKSPPQPPPRKSKMNKNTTAPSTVPKPTVPKRNNKKAQPSAGNKKEPVKDTKQKQTVKETTKKGPSEKKADGPDTKPTEKKVSVETLLNSEQNQQQSSTPISEQSAKNTEPERNDDKVEDDKAFARQELKKMLSKDEDTEIDAMIDEILKSTPHPSMSLSLKSQKSDAEKSQRTPAEILQMSIDARNRLETELNKSQNGKLFCQVPVQKTQIPEDASEMEAKEEEPDVPISLKERKELEKLMNSLRKMELTISLKDSDENHNSKQNSSKNSPTNIKTDNNKPPLPPKPTNTTDSRASSTEKSPRFVRKLDSWKDGNGKPVIPQPVQSGSDTDDDEESLVDDDFHSDALSVASAFSECDDSIVPKDSRVVTSRLGRRSAAGHVSAMSNQESYTEDNVETIQWKRGNMLGKGAYGKVWCGLTNLGELIAVKQIELNINDMEQAELEYEKIQEEVELLKTLKHPNIVGYLGTSLEDNIVSIFMQFIPGGSIANLLARFGALEEEVFCHYTKQILEGVAYLHQNNVIHRDIKGGNVMLMHNGIIKLIDFGCAKRLCLNINSLNNSNKGLLKSMRGTPYWMAPEVVRETGYGTKSDIWSIGCTVFEMATRKPPWADVPPMAAIFAIGTEKETPQLPDKFSDHAIDFVNQCMTRDQHLRPSATELLKHAFLMRRKKKR